VPDSCFHASEAMYSSSKYPAKYSNKRPLYL